MNWLKTKKAPEIDADSMRLAISAVEATLEKTLEARLEQLTRWCKADEQEGVLEKTVSWLFAVLLVVICMYLFLLSAAGCLVADLMINAADDLTPSSQSLGGLDVPICHSEVCSSQSNP
jgi:hypothetical protein